MSRLLTLAVLTFVIVVSPLAVRAADEPADPQKEQDVRKLLELSGSGKLGKQVFDAVIGQMKSQYPQVPEEFWSKASQQADIDGFLNMVIPIYMQHFTDDEIKELIKFYESPIGKKLVQEQPAMMQQSMAAGRKWGFELGQKIAKQMVEKGYIKT